MHFKRPKTLNVSTAFGHDELLRGGYVSNTLDPYFVFSPRDVWHYEIPTVVGEDST
jgi:hypothetical protein